MISSGAGSGSGSGSGSEWYESRKTTNSHIKSESGRGGVRRGVVIEGDGPAWRLLQSTSVMGPFPPPREIVWLSVAE